MKPMTFKGKLTFVLSFVLASTFFIIGISFNSIMNNSILNNARDAIVDSRNIITSSHRMNQRLFVSTQNFLMTPDYESIDVGMMHSPHMLVLHRVMADVLEENELAPSNLIHELRINNELFYVNLIENPSNESQWIVLYISMSTLANLRDNLNLILFVIMAIMLVIGIVLIWFVSSSMTLPLTQLSAFATSVGKGNRKSDLNKYHEKELIVLHDSMNTMVSNLVEQEQASRHFFQNVSHELRTPLQIILAQLEAYQYDFVTKENTLNIITNQGERLKLLIDDLLVLSRLEAHNVDVIVESLDIRDVIEEISSTMHVLIEEKGLDLKYQFPNHPVILKMDSSSLTKVFSNLLTNAIRYSKSKIVWEVFDNAKTIEVKISNDGEMIPEDFKDKIFDRFQKGERGHIGIGLAIVKAVMEHYGGSIQVDSNPEVTSFKLIFKK
ncbi:MAG: HAMP domain-containing histidine kinase [Erysipelothrix sp.]|jgi:signal transduction histidine kinase|nr:HAMP domain-containing histidine kinase [Erysipelothrix sp.]